MDDVKILGIAGGIRRGSYNRAALRAARELAPRGTEVEIFDELGDIPPFSEDTERSPADVVVRLKDRIRAADAILFVSPNTTTPYRVC